MALKLSIAAAIAAADAVTALVDADAGTASLVIYSGVEPANANAALSGNTALVTFELPDPAFDPATDTVNGGTANLNAVTPVDASATGTATFFRMMDDSGDVVLQGSVTDTAGNGDLKVSSTSIVQDIEVTVVSLVYAQPKQ